MDMSELLHTLSLNDNYYSLVPHTVSDEELGGFFILLDVELFTFL